jgi:PIN domain-containing protein
MDEAADGDPQLARERLEVLNEIPLLQLGPEIDAIAAEIMSRAILPPKAQVDALHIATAAHHRIDYLLTWNCTHIANGRLLPRIQAVLVDLSCWIPIICTPEEMVDDDENDEWQSR